MIKCLNKSIYISVPQKNGLDTREIKPERMDVDVVNLHAGRSFHREAESQISNHTPPASFKTANANKTHLKTSENLSFSTPVQVSPKMVNSKPVSLLFSPLHTATNTGSGHTESTPSLAEPKTAQKDSDSKLVKKSASQNVSSTSVHASGKSVDSVSFTGMQARLYQVSCLSRDVRFGPKLGQIGVTWDKSVTFSHQISVQFDSPRHINFIKVTQKSLQRIEEKHICPLCSPSQSVLKSDLKKSQICPLWRQSAPFGPKYDIPVIILSFQFYDRCWISNIFRISDIFQISDMSKKKIL